MQQLQAELAAAKQLANEHKHAPRIRELRALGQTLKGKDAIAARVELMDLEAQREADVGLKEITGRLLRARLDARAEAHQARVLEYSELNSKQRKERLAQIKAEMSRLRAEQRALLVVSTAQVP